MVSFVLSGDVGAIKASAKTWGDFGQTTQSAATQVDCLQYGEFLGSEGVTFSAGVKDDMVPHLNRTSEAWTIVSTALTNYATTLDGLQSRLNALGLKHVSQQSAVNSANASYSQAKADDTQHSKDLETQKASLPGGQTMPPDTYYSQTGSAHSNLTTAQADLTSIQTQATAIHGEHKKALQHCVGQVHKAKNMRIVHPPGRLSRMAHAVTGAFKKGISWAAKNLSPLLKTISAIAGVLALIPGLDVVMGPLALATGAAALAIDVLNKLVNGKGSWLQIGIDTVGLVPGVKSLSTFGKVGRLSSATSKFGRGLRALEAEGGKAAKFFTAADYTNSAVTTAQSTYLAITGKGGWRDVALNVAGTKIPKVDNARFEKIQSLATNGAGTISTGYDIEQNLQHGNQVPLADWTKFGSYAGNTAVHGVNTKKYWNAGVNPDGSVRRKGENPKYDWPQTRNTVTNSRTWRAGGTRVVGLALQYQLRRRPTPAPPPT